jgi:hypothetical protein
MVLTFRRQSNSLYMEHDSATVALGTEEALERMVDAEPGDQQRPGDVADGASADLERDLALAAELRDFGFVAKAHVEHGQAGRREPERRALDDPRRQRDPVDQVDASCGTCGARRASSLRRDSSPRRES